jgi:BolA family transcriptional regulator, general stress-responsive regulator
MNRDQRIIGFLQALAPIYLEVVNESAAHAGHEGDDGTGETHFRVRVDSPKFSGQSRVACQRMIYDLLAPEFKSGLHALSIEIII